MGRKEGGSLFHQLINTPGLFVNSNRELNGAAIQNSYKTQENYKKWLHKAAEYYKAKGIKKKSDITAKEIQAYADSLRSEGYSASTVHSYIAPLCKALAISMAKIRKETRYAAEFSKGSCEALDGGRPGALNAFLGIRRSELLRLHGNDVSYGPNGEMYVYVDKGKGGKKQLQKILPPHCETAREFFDGSGNRLFRRKDLTKANYQAQRRHMAQEALAYYSERLENEPEYRKELYSEIARIWHTLNKKNRGKLEPLSYFSRPYKLRGKNKELAIKQGKAITLDRLALRAVSVLHLAHWRDNITVQSYYFDRQTGSR